MRKSCNALNPLIYICRALWLRGRVSVSLLRGSELNPLMVKHWASYFNLHRSSSLSCVNEYLAIDSGGYVHEQPSCINCSLLRDASQRSRDGVCVNRSVTEVKCKVL